MPIKSKLGLPGLQLFLDVNIDLKKDVLNAKYPQEK